MLTYLCSALWVILVLLEQGQCFRRSSQTFFNCSKNVQSLYFVAFAHVAEPQEMIRPPRAHVRRRRCHMMCFSRSVADAAHKHRIKHCTGATEIIFSEIRKHKALQWSGSGSDSCLADGLDSLLHFHALLPGWRCVWAVTQRVQTHATPLPHVNKLPHPAGFHLIWQRACSYVFHFAALSKEGYHDRRSVELQKIKLTPSHRGYYHHHAAVWLAVGCWLVFYIYTKSPGYVNTLDTVSLL